MTASMMTRARGCQPCRHQAIAPQASNAQLQAPQQRPAKIYSHAKHLAILSIQAAPTQAQTALRSGCRLCLRRASQLHTDTTLFLTL